MRSWDTVRRVYDCRHFGNCRHRSKGARFGDSARRIQALTTAGKGYALATLVGPSAGSRFIQERNSESGSWR